MNCLLNNFVHNVFFHFVIHGFARNNAVSLNKLTTFECLHFCSGLGLLA